jgi:hypothetical protein
MVMNVLLFKISFYMKGCFLNVFCGRVHVLTAGRQKTGADGLELSGSWPSMASVSNKYLKLNTVRLTRLIDLHCLFLLFINHCKPRTF